MKLQRDESIEIIHKGETDWWFGRTSTGQLGWIPREIVENPEPQQVRITDDTSVFRWLVSVNTSIIQLVKIRTQLG